MKQRGAARTLWRSGDRASRCAVCVAIGFSALAVAVLGRTMGLMLQPPEPVERLLAARERLQRQTPLRAAVVDRRGRPVAVTTPAWRAILDPAALPADEAQLDALAVDLCRALDEPCDSLRERIVRAQQRSRRRARRGQAPLRYVRLSGQLDQAQVEALRSLSTPAVWVERYASRTTTGSAALAPLVGKVGADGAGLLGVEAMRDAVLKGRNGAMRIVRDAWGRPLWLEAQRYTPPKQGKPIRLTLDLAVQRIVEEELARGVAEADAAGGRAVVVDPASGEILAMADVLHCPAEAIEPPDGVVASQASPAETNVRYRGFDCKEAADPSLRRLRTLEDVYEPGSTFKPFVWATVTERGLLDPADMIDTEGGRWRTSYGRRIEDVVKRDRQSWKEVLVNSSNIGMVKAAAMLSPQQLHDAIVSFGFGSRTGLGLASEAPGLVTPLSRWTRHTHTSVAFGQEVGVTAVQMARAFCVFAREGALVGTLPSLSLLEDSEPASSLQVRVLSPSTVRKVREALGELARRVDQRLLREGVLALPPRYSMFGKSGTADLPHPKGRGYLKGQYVSSFIAAAPAQDPQLVVLVVIDDPGPETIRRRRHYGSWTAGPVVRRIVERALPYLGVAPDLQESRSAAQRPVHAAALTTEQAG